MLRVDLVLRVVNGVLVAVIVHPICIPKSCIFHIAKTGLVRCCLYTPVGYSGPPSAVNDLSVTKLNEFVKAIRLRFSPKICKQQVAPFDRKPLHAYSFIDFL